MYVDSKVAKSGVAGVIAGVVFANLAWAGVTVSPDVIAADTVGLALVIHGASALYRRFFS